MFQSVSTSNRTPVIGLIAIGLAAIVAALAFAVAPPSANASVYWQQNYLNRSGSVESTLARANSNGSNATDAYIASDADGGASDGTFIYWADTIKRSIGRIGVNGAGANAAFIADAGQPGDIAIGATGLFWVNNGGIASANLDGTNANLNLIPAANAAYVAVDSNYVYWTSNTGAAVGRANLDGSNINMSFVAGVPGSLGGIAVNSASIFVASGDPSGANGSEGIWKANLDGSGAALLTSAPNSASDVAVDATSVYWSDTGNAGADAASGLPSYNVGAIGQMPLDGSAPANPALITGLGAPNWLAVDATTSATAAVASRSLMIKRNRSRASVTCRGTGSCFGTLSIVTAPKYRVGKDRRARLTLGTGHIRQLAGKRANVTIDFNAKTVRRAFGGKRRIVAYAQIGNGKFKRILLCR